MHNVKPYRECVGRPANTLAFDRTIIQMDCLQSFAVQLCGMQCLNVDFASRLKLTMNQKEGDKELHKYN